MLKTDCITWVFERTYCREEYRIAHLNYYGYICIITSRDFYSNIGRMLSERLKDLREKAKLPQRKLAAALDIDTATYSKIENGLYLPKKDHLLILSKLLDVDHEELLRLWMADKIAAVTKEDDASVAQEALKIVQDSLK